MPDPAQIDAARLGALVHAFAEIIEMSQQHADPTGSDPSSTAADAQWQGGRLYPMMGAVALASVLERLSMYHVSIEELGGSREQLIETLATLLYGEAARGTYENGAIAALLIVCVVLAPVGVLSRLTDYRP